MDGREEKKQVRVRVYVCVSDLRGPLNRLNAIRSLLQPIDRYRIPSAMGSAIGRPLSRPISHPRAGRSSHPPRSKPLRGLNQRRVWWRYSVQNPFYTRAKQKRDRDRDSQPRPLSRLNSQLQGATKCPTQTSAFLEMAILDACLIHSYLAI